MSQASETRRVYAIEASWKAEEWPIAKLRKLAVRVWRCEAGSRHPHRHYPPSVVAGHGVMYNGRLLSYCYPNYYPYKIVLARNQRDPKVLIHELVHLLRRDGKHDIIFEDLLGHLLNKYHVNVELR